MTEPWPEFNKRYFYASHDGRWHIFNNNQLWRATAASLDHGFRSVCAEIVVTGRRPEMNVMYVTNYSLCTMCRAWLTDKIMRQDFS